MSDDHLPSHHAAVEKPGSRLAVGIGIATIVLALMPAVFFYWIDGVASWFAGIGTVLVAVGVFAPSRGGTSAGVFMLATGSLVASSGEPLPYTFLLNGLMATICIGVLLGADWSYATRRAAVVSPVTVRGMIGVHAIAVAIGLLVSITTLSIVLAVTWPGWLLLAPALLLVLGVVGLIRMVRRYQQGLITVPQPPAPTGAPTAFRPGPAPVGTRVGALPPPSSSRLAPPPPPPRWRQQLPPPPPGAGQIPPPPPRR